MVQNQKAFELALINFLDNLTKNKEVQGVVYSLVVNQQPNDIAQSLILKANVYENNTWKEIYLKNILINNQTLFDNPQFAIYCYSENWLSFLALALDKTAQYNLEAEMTIAPYEHLNHIIYQKLNEVHYDENVNVSFYYWMINHDTWFSLLNETNNTLDLSYDDNMLKDNTVKFASSLYESNLKPEEITFDDEDELISNYSK